MLILDLSSKQLDRKEILIREVLDYSAIILPGQSIFRGHLLWELQQTLIERITGRLEKTNKKQATANKQYLTLVKEARESLAEAAEILSNEPPGTVDYAFACQKEERMLYLDKLQTALLKCC